MPVQEIILKRGDLKKYVKSLPEIGPFGEKVLTNLDGTVLVNKNITSLEPAEFAEIHDNFVDIFVVVEGKEELFVGGGIKDKKSVSAGEWLGAGLSGARKYDIAAGDIVIIPKGVAHQHGQGAVKMIVIKTS
jgi:mannose-6-phosphate isomerase-like protein (cupin superfamily)